MNNQKIKSILTSKITVGISCFILGGLALGGTTPEVDVTKERYEQLLEFEKLALNKEAIGKSNDILETSNNSEESSELSNGDGVKTSNNESLTEEVSINEGLGVGETFYLKKASGVKLMGLTINSVKLIDDRNQFSDKEANKVVEIEYTYENLGYDENLNVFDSNFKIYDDSGKILERYPAGSNKFPQAISRGKKCTASMAFALNNESNNLEIEFYENMFSDKSECIFKVVAE
ncbi:DUF4352 domain-containing protein [Clostridium sp. B9]|uniref:DUF4352 domain-containing protein n=1 Tax=Clostridium sp. B9 TaxID=3423224 RepID=UPI003D2F33E1